MLISAGLVAIAASCDRVTSPARAAETPLPVPAPNLAFVSCSADVTAQQLRCVNVDSARATGVQPHANAVTADIVLGGQNENVKLAATNVAYANGIFSFDATVQNLIGQPLGTTDGVSAAANGIRVFFISGPTATAGSGTIDFVDPAGGGSLVDGRDTFTASNQPYVQYATMLDTGAVSAARHWRIHVPATVSAFAFAVYVSAPVRYPEGWVSVSPGTKALAATKTVTLAATVRDVFGHPVLGQPVTWASATPAVATVNASTGKVTAVAAGRALVTATSGTRSGDATVAVTPAGAVGISVNTANRFGISRFVYGINFSESGSAAGAAPWYGATPPAEVTMNRFGGNRLTAYNWENNYSNAGNDYQFSSDNYLSGSTTPGDAVKTRVQQSAAKGAGTIVTVPMLGYVAADANGSVTTTDADRANRLATRFRVSKAFKGSAFTLAPNANDGFVYQDEFVNWVVKTFPNSAEDPTKPIFYSLDNEPDIWNSTHKEIQSDIGDNTNTPRLFTYDQFADTTILYARAIKSVAPNAVVFGPAVATYAGIVSGGRYQSKWFDDPKYGEANFVDVYLDRMRQAEATYGRRLLDVLDVHWYPAAGTANGEVGDDGTTQDAAMTDARLQSPRSLWDATYDEASWVSGVTGGPIRLIPRLREQIAAHYPGTKIAVTEYYYGRAGDVSGGLAQADVLGVFGREGVFAATLWPNANVYATPYGGSGVKAYAYAFGAFKLFLNYDGAGGRFGDTGVAANTTDDLNVSTFASLDAQHRVVIVAINKNRTTALPATIQVADPRTLATVAGVYRMASGTPTPAAVATSLVTANGSNSFSYTLPALSATVIVLAP